MSAILFYSFATLFVLFFLGYGVTHILLPKQLKSYAFWFSPWYTIILLIFSLTIFNLVGFSVSQVSLPIIICFTILTLLILWKQKPSLKRMRKENIFLALFLLISIGFNLSPLIRRHKFLTAVSMGNNDVIVYTEVPDYLIHHSLIESFYTKVSLGVSNLLQDGYRWGPPLLSAFFQHIFRLEGYQFVYLFQVILFALAIPLIYIFLTILYKPTLFGLLMSLVLFTFNVNLLYMLYHDFFGQVLFWGLEIILFIFIYIYFTSLEDKTRHFNLYDFNLGIAFAVLFISYHEGALFLLFPLFLFLSIRLLYKKDLQNWLSLIKVGFVTSLMSSIVIVRGILFDYMQAFRGNPNQPIGWPVFRNKLPFANPFEMIGFYSIHSFEPLPAFLALLLSIGIIAILCIGLLRSKNRFLSICYVVFAFLFLTLFFFVRSDFWVYNRSLTYNLPLILILFSIGITDIFQNRMLLKRYIFISVILLELFSAVKLNKRFLKEHLVVDKSFISLREIQQKNTSTDPIYLESTLDDTISYWRQIWTGYFLYAGHPSPSLPSQINPFEKRISDNSLVLLSKTTPWFTPPQILLKSPLVWENEYFVLGRLCNSTECLLNRPEDLSKITLGKNSFEDSLLISGWSVKEPESRWAMGRESTLRLVTKDASATQLVFEAHSLSEPQRINIYMNDTLLGTQSLTAGWATYIFPLPYEIKRGVQNIRLEYSNTYKPSEVLKNQDTRDLAVNFRRIGFQ